MCMNCTEDILYYVPHRYLIISLDYGIFYHIEERDWRGMWHEYEEGELHIGLMWGVLRGRGHLRDLVLDEGILLKGIGLI